MKSYVDADVLARVLVVGLDRHGCICLFNREAERVTGFDRDEVLGAPFAETLLPEDVLASHARRIRDVAIGRRTADEIRHGVIRTRKHEVRSVHWQLAFVASDEPIVVFAIGRDTTDEQRRLERVREHDTVLSMGTLAAHLAHEIRNPLNGAQLHVSFLERTLKRNNPDGEILAAVEVVANEIKRLATLVTTSLDFVRPARLILGRVSVNELCKRIEPSLAEHARRLNVRLAIDLPMRDLVVIGDAPKLEQMLTNVVQNAIEAATGDSEVTVTARQSPRHVVIEVEHARGGLAADDNDETIYQAFYATKANATVLGLVIAHRIVTEHRGFIDVESRRERTCFRITLPLDVSEFPSGILDSVDASLPLPRHP